MKKKILAFVLAVLMLLGCMAGCAQPSTDADPSASTQTPAAEAATGEEPYEISVWWPSVWGWAKGGTTWDPTLDTYQAITDATGCTMNIDVPSGSEAETVGAMIAGGDYADVIVFENYNNAYIQQLIDGGLVYSWSELIDTYCPEMWDKIPDSMMANFADEDGTLWYYSGFGYHENWAEESKALGNEPAGGTALKNVVFCRKDILDAFGAEDITDLETFTEFIRFAKKNYPELDPVYLFADDPRDEYGLFRHFSSTFDIGRSNTYNLDDGTVKHYMYSPEYVEYLQWLNGLYNEGVITANQLTDDFETEQTKLFGGQYACMVSATYEVYNTINTSQKELYGDDTDMIYVDVGPIQGDVEWKTDLIRSRGSYTSLITKNCKDPEKVIKFFNYLFSDEGQKIISCGVEGTAWWYNEDGTVGHEENRAATALADLTEYCSTYHVTGNFAPWINTSYWEGLLGPMISPPEGEIVEVQNKRLGPQYVTDIWAEGYGALTDAIPAGTDLYTAYTKINDACKTAGMKMITAASQEEFDQLYRDCIAEIERMGAADVNAALTAEHQAQCAALGIEP